MIQPSPQQGGSKSLPYLGCIATEGAGDSTASLPSRRTEQYIWRHLLRLERSLRLIALGARSVLPRQRVLTPAASDLVTVHSPPRRMVCGCSALSAGQVGAGS